MGGDAPKQKTPRSEIDAGIMAVDQYDRYTEFNRPAEKRLRALARQSGSESTITNQRGKAAVGTRRIRGDAPKTVAGIQGRAEATGRSVSLANIAAERGQEEKYRTNQTSISRMGRSLKSDVDNMTMNQVARDAKRAAGEQYASQMKDSTNAYAVGSLAGIAATGAKQGWFKGNGAVEPLPNENETETLGRTPI